MDINYITIIGLTAAVMTAASSFPQMVKVIKTKRADDLSLGTYWLLTIGVFLWLVYGIFIRDLPVIVANMVSLLFVTTILVLKIRYK